VRQFAGDDDLASRLENFGKVRLIEPDHLAVTIDRRRRAARAATERTWPTKLASSPADNRPTLVRFRRS
jgi:hypothetical protein